MKLVADENFNNDIVRGVLRRLPEADFARVQDHGLAGASDEDILGWAAVEGRIVVTHDVATMGPKALERVERGLPMPGVFQVARRVPILQAIEGPCARHRSQRGRRLDRQVRFLPL